MIVWYLLSRSLHIDPTLHLKTLIYGFLDETKSQRFLLRLHFFPQSVVSLLNFINVKFLSLYKSFLCQGVSATYVIHVLDPILYYDLALWTLLIDLGQEPSVVKDLWFLNNILNEPLSSLLCE